MKRREFVKISSGSLMGLALGRTDFWKDQWSASPLRDGDESPARALKDPSPLQRCEAHQWNSSDFNGDDIGRPHEALWNREGYLAKKGGIPPVTERVDTVIVGGGLSGLLSAYLMKDRQPVVLEMAENFGGNSRGEFFEGSSPYSIGGAYITKPDPGSEIETLLVELGLMDQARRELPSDSKILFQNLFLEKFWEGTTDPAAHDQFRQVIEKLQSVLEQGYPEIPWTPEGDLSLAELNQLDQLSFSEWLKGEFGPVHPHVLEYFQLYCWSSFGGSIEEISAAQALNFLAAETEEILAFPGGNAALAQSLYERLLKENGPSCLRAGSLVLDITIDKKGVRICYETFDLQIKTILATHCIVAAPKFVAKRIVSDMGVDQRNACDRIEYRSYVVANIFYRKPGLIQEPFSPCFDLFVLEDDVPPAPSALKTPKRPFTDICFGSWASQDQGARGTLTVYKPLPYQGAKQFLFSPLSHQKHQLGIERGMEPVLESLRLPKENILGMRLTRWGHALPLALRGGLATGHATRASQSIGQRIFFANQDNFLNPSFESAFAAALEARNQVLGAPSS